MGVQIEVPVLDATNEIDREVPGEEQRFEKNEHPHVRLPRYEPSGLALKLFR